MLSPMTKFAVVETFYTLQGDGHHTGRPAVFIRLAGCNLQCPWCDTDFKMKERLTSVAIGDRVETFLAGKPGRDGVLLVLTGGEPTLQDYAGLVITLRHRFPRNPIAMETNGRDSAHWVQYHLRSEQGLFVTVSPKLAVEDCERFFNNPDWKGDELKVVLDPKADLSLLPALPWRLGNRFRHYYIQPCSEDYAPAIQLVKENPCWKLSLQTQKMVGIQ